MQDHHHQNVFSLSVSSFISHCSQTPPAGSLYDKTQPYPPLPQKIFQTPVYLRSHPCISSNSIYLFQCDFENNFKSAVYLRSLLRCQSWPCFHLNYVPALSKYLINIPICISLQKTFRISFVLVFFAGSV